MFKEEYKVNISDINYGGHMGNERSLLLFQQCRISWLKSIGLSEFNIGGDVGIIQSKASIDYHQESFLGDILEIEIKKIEASKTSFNIFYHITNKTTNILITSGSTLLIAYDYKTKKIKRLPKEFKEKIELN